MKAIIVKTKKEAIEVAKNTLRDLTSQKRLQGLRIKNTSCQCACGETQAVQVETYYTEIVYPYGRKTKVMRHDYKIVGICKNCGE